MTSGTTVASTNFLRHSSGLLSTSPKARPLAALCCPPRLKMDGPESELVGKQRQALRLLPVRMSWLSGRMVLGPCTVAREWCHPLSLEKMQTLARLKFDGSIFHLHYSKQPVTTQKVIPRILRSSLLVLMVQSSPAELQYLCVALLQRLAHPHLA